MNISVTQRKEDNEDNESPLIPKLKIMPIKQTFLTDNALISKVLATSFLLGIGYAVFRVLRSFYQMELKELTFNKFVAFLDGKNIISVIIGMMVAENARDFVKSLTNNLILPILKPIMPFLQTDYPVQIGPFVFDFGTLISDLMMFLINLYIIYVIMAMFSSSDMTSFGSTVAV